MSEVILRNKYYLLALSMIKEAKDMKYSERGRLQYLDVAADSLFKATPWALRERDPSARKLAIEIIEDKRKCIQGIRRELQDGPKNT